MNEDEKTGMTLSTHLIFYIGLYFVGALVGSQIGWIIGMILSGLNFIKAPWAALIVLTLFIVGAYFPRLWFGRKVSALCPSCGGKAYIKWPSRPITYACSDCGKIHETKLRLGR
jgi:hypothetical protein